MTDISKIQVGQSSYDIKDEKAARISHTHKTSEITGLSTVATSGNYSDLKGKPSAATENVDGLMSAADKKRLDGIANVKEWVVSRGQNLVSNGYATLGNNTNFSDFTFDGADAFQSGGSFSYKATYPDQALTDELMPYDPSIIYKLSYYIKSDCASALYYDFLDCYDIDGNRIGTAQVEFTVGSTTTLVADLKPGDTSVSVKSAAGFNSSDSDGRQYYNRGLMFWNYTNSFGYTYPPETYTRNRYNDLWTSNTTAINKTSNRIMLDKAWSGPTVPKGTSVSQTERSSDYAYGNSGFSVPVGEWTHKEFTFKNRARPGTAYVKIGWLIPNDLGGVSSVTTKLTSISFGAEYATQASLNSYKTTNDQAVAAAKKAGTDAQATANTANTNASNAVMTANQAVVTANGAVVTASAAQATANTANSTANSAKSIANQAVTTANSAKSTADVTATLIRPYVNGVLVANTNAPVGALVNANGSFDVVTLGWSSKGEPQVQVTLCSFEDDCATIGNNAVNGQKGISTKWPLNVQNGMTVDELSFSKTPEWHVGRHVDGKCDSAYCVQSGTVFWTVHIDDGWWPLPTEQWTSIGGSLFSDITHDNLIGIPPSLRPTKTIWFTAMNYNGNGFMGVIYPDGTAMLHPPNGTEGANNWSFSVSWPIGGA